MEQRGPNQNPDRQDNDLEQGPLDVRAQGSPESVPPCHGCPYMQGLGKKAVEMTKFSPKAKENSSSSTPRDGFRVIEVRPASRKPSGLNPPLKSPERDAIRQNETRLTREEQLEMAKKMLGPNAMILT